MVEVIELTLSIIIFWFILGFIICATIGIGLVFFWLFLKVFAPVLDKIDDIFW